LIPSTSASSSSEVHLIFWFPIQINSPTNKRLL
jgi:hypothetical protein